MNADWRRAARELELPDGKSIQAWLVERLAVETKTVPEQIDLDKSAEQYALDSIVVVQICADLGQWIQGREFPIDQWWGAPTLRSFCNSCAGEQATASQMQTPVSSGQEARLEGEGNAEMNALGTALERIDAGKSLFVLARAKQVVAPGERHLVAVLSIEPELVALSYQQVDETTGEIKGSIYYGGSYARHLRAWTSPTALDGETRYELYVLNSGERRVAAIVAALTTDPARGAR